MWNVHGKEQHCIVKCRKPAHFMHRSALFFNLLRYLSYLDAWWTFWLTENNNVGKITGHGKNYRAPQLSVRNIFYLGRCNLKIDKIYILSESWGRRILRWLTEEESDWHEQQTDGLLHINKDMTVLRLTTDTHHHNTQKDYCSQHVSNHEFIYTNLLMLGYKRLKKLQLREFSSYRVFFFAINISISFLFCNINVFLCFIMF